MKHLTVVGIIGIKRKRWYLAKMQTDIGNPSLLKHFSCAPMGYVKVHIYIHIYIYIYYIYIYIYVYIYMYIQSFFLLLEYKKNYVKNTSPTSSAGQFYMNGLHKKSRYAVCLKNENLAPGTLSQPFLLLIRTLLFPRLFSCIY